MVEECKIIIRKIVTINDSNGRERKATAVLLTALLKSGSVSPPSPRIGDHAEAPWKCSTSHCSFFLESQNLREDAKKSRSTAPQCTVSLHTTACGKMS